MTLQERGKYLLSPEEPMAFIDRQTGARIRTAADMPTYDSHLRGETARAYMVGLCLLYHLATLDEEGFQQPGNLDEVSTPADGEGSCHKLQLGDTGTAGVQDC